MIFGERDTDRCVDVSFRPFQRGDGEGFRRCIEDFYGDGYPYREYLDEEFLLEKCASGRMAVLCGVTSKGEIISTSAVQADDEFSGSALLMLRVVKKAYRGMGIGKAQEERLFEYVERLEGIHSLYADVMTHNSISQKSLVRRGFIYCGVRMMLYRNPVMVPDLPLAKDGKMSQAVMCRKGCTQSVRALYCPMEHAGVALRIYRELGVKCQIFCPAGTADNAERANMTLKLPDSTETDMTWKEEVVHDSYIMKIRKTGADFSKIMEHKMGQVARQEYATVLCYLNLRDPEAVSAYEVLRKKGFFFTGFKPLQENEEYMLLTYTGGQTIRYEDIHLHREGELLLHYIKKHQKCGSLPEGGKKRLKTIKIK